VGYLLHTPLKRPFISDAIKLIFTTTEGDYPLIHT
jgi:hypothetical protein